MWRDAGAGRVVTRGNEREIFPKERNSRQSLSKGKKRVSLPFNNEQFIRRQRNERNA